ncbi:MAG TPA: CoB--CoM heterodisulfide reductase iron-sulfur subunit A family protein [Syntrophaceae bacterium]|nr:CoB--CoM heterodisulfide reductase iron-sulfur subunit A family protein [Syntrophaceae bacterium]
MIRIGVFICHCGINIAGSVDIEEVVEYAATLQNVVHVERNLYTCSEEGLTAIKNAIREHNLTRIVVASCTPRTHSPLFQRTCEEAGLNKYLFELVNIREQCSWVHQKNKEKATQKAKDLVRMGVARARLLEPQEELRMQVEPSATVIGAGISGMTAALSIATQGFEVHLVEKENELGGMLNKLNKLYPDNKDSKEILIRIKNKVKANKKIKLHKKITIKNIEGYIGNFNITLSDGESFKSGVIIVATGATEYKPKVYGYNKYDKVITQLELEEMLREGSLNANNIVMIQCAGAKRLLGIRSQVSDVGDLKPNTNDLTPNEGVEYCSRICCTVAVKNAILIKELNQDANITILHNDMEVYGVGYESMYRKAQEVGINFKKFSPENPPFVEKKGEKLKVRFYHELLGIEREYLVDLVVLSTPLIPTPDAENLAKLLKVPLGQDRFYYEAHVKLRPVDFATDGIFLCGTAHAPADIKESITQAYAAASRATIPLDRGYVLAEAITSEVNPEKCIGCGTCVEVCPFQSIILNEEEVKTEEVAYITKKASINPAMCKGCGSCAAACPVGAINAKHFTSPQILATIKAFGGGIEVHA